MITFWIVFTVGLFTTAAMVYIFCTRKRYRTVDSYLTARGTLGTGVATATVFASIMGAWILFSPPESGTWGGILALGGYAVAQALAIVFFAVVGPRLRRIAPRGSTLPEFVYHRYGTGMYILTLVSSVFYMAIFLAAELTGIALAVNLVTGFPLWATALLVGGGTLLYTAYGGIRGSIFTDTVQAAIIIPALLAAFIATLIFLGGAGSVLERAREINPNLLNLGHRGGWEFTITLLIAVVAANTFHQGFWSRVYAARDDATVRKSFLAAGIMIVPVMALAGCFGIMALITGEPVTPSIAMFEVVLSATPAWVVALVMVLAVALVMSSVDTVINAIAGIFTVDLARFKKELSPGRLIVYARVITAVICAVIILVAARGYSVLYLFFVADLVCAAAVVPTFYGLYAARYPGWAAVVATLAGIACGAALFPDPAFTRGNLLLSFAAALLIPAALTLIFSRSGKPIDLSRVGRNIPGLHR